MKGLHMIVNRLSKISVSDKRLFQYNSDVMNECFGGNYNHYFNDAIKEVYGANVWFPKERVKGHDGEWQPGSKEVNWKNYVSDDGKKVYMYLNPGETVKDSVKERPEKPKTATPCHVFMKSDKFDGYYKYVGTFLNDINASTGDVRISRLVKDEIDLSIWFNNENAGYYDVDGNPAFDRMYLGGNFKSHKKIISSFDYLSHEEKFDNRVKMFKNDYALPRIVRLGEDSFKADFITELTEIIKSIYGRELKVKDLYPSNKSFQEIGMEYYKLLTSEDYNNNIKSSILGSQIAGMIKGVYDSYFFIYGMEDEDIDTCLKRIGYEDKVSEDRIEKCCLLYFWKQCMCELDAWTIPAYIEFVKSLA